MAEPKSTDLFWVESCTSDAPSDTSKWLKRRRQVMQRVASRREKTLRQPHPNRRQLPVFVGDRSAIASSESQSIDQGTCPRLGTLDPATAEFEKPHSLESLTHIRVAAVYPSILVQANLDFTDLSSLASIEVGRYTGQRLVEWPRGITHFLRGTTWSYCHYVPFYYSQSALIRDATDCVVARVKCLLASDTTDRSWELVAIASYAKALSRLQEAINSTSQQPTVEVLCTTQILSLYEVRLSLRYGSHLFLQVLHQLLNPRRINAWSKHAAGAASVIKLRGPAGYVSEFEKSLFMSHLGPIVSSEWEGWTVDLRCADMDILLTD